MTRLLKESSFSPTELAHTLLNNFIASICPNFFAKSLLFIFLYTKQNATSLMCQLPPKADEESRNLYSEELRFIYDKHLDLFNVRREHEWRVFFGMITLIGLSSAALLNYYIHLTSLQKILWSVGICILFTAHFLYQKGIQRRNRIDRIVMDEVTRHICAFMGLDATCYIRLAVDAGAEQDAVQQGDLVLGPWYSSRYIWAFALQNVTVLIICIFSLLVALGGVKNETPVKSVTAVNTVIPPEQR